MYFSGLNLIQAQEIMFLLYILSLNMIILYTYSNIVEHFENMFWHDLYASALREARIGNSEITEKGTAAHKPPVGLLASIKKCANLSLPCLGNSISTRRRQLNIGRCGRGCPYFGS